MIGHDPEHTYKAAVIGAGSGGLTLAIGLAGFDHDIVLIEGDRVGGDCTNVGCIPSKALLHAARVGEHDPLAWVRSRRDELAEREDTEMEEHDRIHLVRGWARLTGSSDPHVVAVAGPDGTVEVRAEHVIVCGGSTPIEIPVDGLDPGRLLSNENVFELDAVPESIVLVGGGAIALEMATAFCDLRTRVDIVELADRLIATEDPLVSSTIHDALVARGVRIHIGTSMERFDEPTRTAHLDNGNTIEGVDKVFVSVGRRARVGGLDLEAAGVETYKGGIVADDWGRTSVDKIWAVGDITGNTQTTHGASAIGRRTVRAIALPLPKVGDPRVLPNAVYSRPEIASVGMSIDDLNALPEAGRARYVKHLRDIDRGFTDDVEFGFVAVDVERFTGKILRAAIVGPSAAEMIGMFTMMIDQGIGLRKMFGSVHPYPAYSQVIGLLADDFADTTYRNLRTELFALARGRVARMLRR